jgi:hypothetical protein
MPSATSRRDMPGGRSSSRSDQRRRARAARILDRRTPSFGHSRDLTATPSTEISRRERGGAEAQRKQSAGRTNTRTPKDAGRQRGSRRTPPQGRSAPLLLCDSAGDLSERRRQPGLTAACRDRRAPFSRATSATHPIADSFNDNSRSIQSTRSTRMRDSVSLT